jgi:hypothetical protein
MGSGAFLVAACRYLADKLIEAWSSKGDPRAQKHLADSLADSGLALDSLADPLVIDARRQIIEHCLYGVDVNPMAVEMAKLSLWLVSMDSRRPFTFLDDRLVAGDSLLGVTSIEQLEWMHLDPRAGRRLHEGVVLLDFMAGVRSLLTEVVDERLGLVSISGDDIDAVNKKREILADVRAKTEKLTRYANLIAGAALAGSRKRGRAADPSLREEMEDEGQERRQNLWLIAAKTANEAATRDAIEVAKEEARSWLATDQPEGAFDRHPLHWPLVFPEVFDPGRPNGAGFDAIIGNPPFLGGKKQKAALGDAYREYLVQVIAEGVRGSADLVAYFTLRAHALVNEHGTTGLITKSSLAEGTNKVISLDRIIGAGTAIYLATRSRVWPAKSADIRYCAICTTGQPIPPDAFAHLDGRAVSRIDSSLEEASAVEESAQILRENEGIAFQGAIALGTGFEVSIEEAARLLAVDAENGTALFPYLDGDDLNSRCDLSAGRWIINFHDWSEERAKTYRDLYAQVLLKVKAERLANNDKGARTFWWRFVRPRPNLTAAISSFEQVVVVARVSSTVAPTLVSSRQVFHDKIVVFATDDPAFLASLASAVHYWWVAGHTTRHGGAGDITYAHRQCFETFPRPPATNQLRVLGGELDSLRREVMLSRKKGMTDIYRLVHDRYCTDADIAQLREIHRTIDEAAVRAYEWDELLASGLDHGFHETRQGTRYTIGATVQQVILGRLLELNHERHATEDTSGLHHKRRRKRAVQDTEETTLF